MTETVLFVGGSADGKQLHVCDGVDRIEIPVMQGSPLAVEVFSREDVYLRQIIYTYEEMKEHSIFLISTESPDNLIPLLIKEYRKDKI